MEKLIEEIRPMRSADTPIPPDAGSRASQAPPSLATVAYNRMAFGLTPTALADFNALGATDAARLQAFINQQLNPDSIDDSDCEARVAAASYITTDLSREMLWERYQRRTCPSPGDPDYDYYQNDCTSEDINRQRPIYELERMTFMRAVYSKRQLNEVLANFWHDHFSVNGTMDTVRSSMIHYDRDCIRAHLLGNFRELLKAVAKSTAMLYYLDNYTSSVAGPNENYARELLELHTLGEEHYLGSGILSYQVEKDEDGWPIGYADGDVYEASRCFTGWTVDNNNAFDNSGAFLVREDWHDRNLKFLLGGFVDSDQDAVPEGEIVLDRLCQSPYTARFICRKLCKRLVSDTPSEALVQSAADVFHAQWDQPDQLKQVVRHILESAEFSTTWGGKVKRPFELAVSAMRAINIDIEFTYTGSYNDTNRFLGTYNELGQQLFSWPAPNGFPDVAPYWLNTTSMFKRFRLLNWLVMERDGDSNYYADIVAQTPANSRSANAMVAFWTDRVYGYAISAEEQAELVKFMAQGYNPDLDLPLATDSNTQDRLRALVALTMMMPSFQWR